MARTNVSPAESAPVPASPLQRPPMFDLEEELRRAEEDFERGDYIELTREQLEHCIQTGESPWPDESRG